MVWPKKKTMKAEEKNHGQFLKILEWEVFSKERYRMQNLKVDKSKYIKITLGKNTNNKDKR